MPFVPSPGDHFNVFLPHETIRAEVLDVIDDDTILVGLNLGAPLGKANDYKAGEWVRCRRQPGILGEKWVAVERVAKPAPPASEAPKGKRRERTS